MSIQMNTYVIRGVLLQKKQYHFEFEDLEPYMDSPFGGIKHHDGLCVLNDGICGRYIAIGRVIAKTGANQGFESGPVPVDDSSVVGSGDAELREKIAAIVGCRLALNTYVISHYR
jgi:hypothetical protein